MVWATRPTPGARGAATGAAPTVTGTGPRARWRPAYARWRTCCTRSPVTIEMVRTASAAAIIGGSMVTTAPYPAGEGARLHDRSGGAPANQPPQGDCEVE